MARRKPEYPEKNLSEEGREPTTIFNPHMAFDLTPGPHWREASALTIAPPFSPKGNKAIKSRTLPYLTPLLVFTGVNMLL